MIKRKCEICGAISRDECVMKIKFEDGSCEKTPLNVCPRCFKEKMRYPGYAREKNLKITREFT